MGQRRRTCRIALVLAAGLLVVSSGLGTGGAVAATPGPAPATQGSFVAAAGSDSAGVERLYLAYFLRDPDPTGLAHWRRVAAAGSPLTAISDAFAASAEFRQRYGSLSDRDFVALVYRNVLSRRPDADGYAYWLGRIAAGMTRGTLMTGFSESDEFKALHRRRTTQQPEPSELTGVVPRAVDVVLGTDGLPTAPAGTWKIGSTVDGTAMTWAPCRTVGVVANFTDAPAGAKAALVDALAQISAATRITWRYEGTTDERAPSARFQGRPLTDPARYGDRYSPVLVSWAPDWSDGGTAIGYGGFVARWQGGEPPHAVSGAVTLDPRWRPRSSADLTSLLLHELAHVANLGHVDHRSEVMYPVVNGLATYQRGDLAGLARVGAWQTDCTRAAARAQPGVDPDQTAGVPALIEWFDEGS